MACKTTKQIKTIYYWNHFETSFKWKTKRAHNRESYSVMMKQHTKQKKQQRNEEKKTEVQ